MVIAAALAAMMNPCDAQIVIYPAKGQSASQQEQDRKACSSWATQQSGYNPAQPVPQAPPVGGAAPLGGAARGAAVGAIGGAIGGNAGKGAAVGASAGALVGGMNRRNQYAQQQAYSSQQKSLFNRAMGTCMQGRGYTVG
jgi:hypothetical protein